MKLNLISGLFVIFILTLTSSCGKSEKGNSFDSSNEYISLDGIPSEYNPRDFEETFEVIGLDYIRVNLFGFNDNFEVSYSKGLPSGKGLIKGVIVSKEGQYPLGNPVFVQKNKELQIKEYGSYMCSIEVKNGKITALKGTCYVKIQVTLPFGMQTEVYNVDQLKSQRFFPISNEEFIEEIESASFDDGKFKVIESFKESYRITGKKIVLRSEELGRVLKKFSFRKHDALRMLHIYVQDRESLSRMIEEVFSYFDRDEARRIVGF